MSQQPKVDTWTEREGNLPDWPDWPDSPGIRRASAVYSKAYRLMEQHGADDLLIEALNKGSEETIKFHMLRINGDYVTAREDAE